MNRRTLSFSYLFLSSSMAHKNRFSLIKKVCKGVLLLLSFSLPPSLPPSLLPSNYKSNAVANAEATTGTVTLSSPHGTNSTIAHNTLITPTRPTTPRVNAGTNPQK